MGPPLLVEVYNLEDAPVCAQYLTSFARNADLAKLGCLAQIVNVIAPIMTSPDGILVQTINHPFRMIIRTFKRAVTATIAGGAKLSHRVGRRGSRFRSGCFL